MAKVIPYDLLDEDIKFELGDIVGRLKNAGLDLYVISLVTEDDITYVNFRILNLPYVIQIFVDVDKLTPTEILEEINRQMYNRLHNSMRLYDETKAICENIYKNLKRSGDAKKINNSSDEE